MKKKSAGRGQRKQRTASLSVVASGAKVNEKKSAESWRPVSGFAGLYMVSDLGRVRSTPRKGTPGTLLRPAIMRKGHLRAGLTKGGKVSGKYVHRLVLEAFVGPCPPSMEACHAPDPNPANCRLDNLRWDTRIANAHDRDLHGNTARGSRNGRAKLTASAIPTIFQMRNGGSKLREIASAVGVSNQQVSEILRGQHWGRP